MFAKLNAFFVILAFLFNPLGFIHKDNISNSIVSNLVLNPSVEQGSGQPTNWHIFDSGATFTWSSSIAHTGTHSLCMSNVKANSSVDWVSDAITVTPGQSYTFGGWVKGDSDREADISIFPKDASGNWLAGTYIDISYNNITWTYREYTFIPPANAKTAIVDLGINNPGAYSPASVCFDDLILGLTSSTKDNGFRPNTYGYSFANFAGSQNEFGTQDLVSMFGPSATCTNSSGSCNIQYSAKIWLEDEYKFRLGAHCLGMSITALRFYKGQDSVKQYNSNASKTYDLKDNTIQISNHIARYHVTQDIPGIADAINSKLSHTANDALNDLKNSVNQSNSDPQVLGITNKSNGELVDGHTVVPYMVTDQGSGIFWIWVYDPNKPGTSNNHVIINTNINTWNYQGTTSYNGSGAIAAFPISLFAQPNPYYRCPWCINNVAYPVYFAGLGDLLITDQSGNRLGFVNGVSYSEIPGAYINPPLDDLQSSPSQNLMLPSTNTYSIQILGNSQITGTSDTTISQFGPGFSASLDDLPVSSTTADDMVISPTGDNVIFHSNENNLVDLNLTNEDTTSYGFDISQLTIAKNQEITLHLDKTQSQISISGNQNGTDTYNFEIHTDNGTNMADFIHLGITLSGSDTEYLDFSSLNTTNTVILKIDNGSDGSIDSTIPLTNDYKYKLFFPFVLR